MEILAPINRFSSVDLPTFGAPIRATKPQRVGSFTLARLSATDRACQRLRIPPPGAIARGLAPGDGRAGSLPSRRSDRAAGLRWRPADRRAVAIPGPAPIPEARAWHPGAALPAPPARAATSARPRGAPPPTP